MSIRAVLIVPGKKGRLRAVLGNVMRDVKQVVSRQEIGAISHL